MGSIRVVQGILIVVFLVIALAAIGVGFHYVMQAQQLANSPAPTFAPIPATAGEKSSTASKPQQPAAPYYHNVNNSVQIDTLR